MTPLLVCQLSRMLSVPVAVAEKPAGAGGGGIDGVAVAVGVGVGVAHGSVVTDMVDDGSPYAVE